MRGELWMDSTYTVITADIIDSKKKFYRPEEVLQLQERIEIFNDEVKEDLVSSFSLSRGDEVQGVMKSPEHLLAILRKLRYRFYPLEIRIGIGIGEIATPVNPGDSWAMNGEAFYLAREALDEVKGKRWDKTRLRTENPLLEKGVLPILKLLDIIQDKWTAQQWEAIHLYEKTGTLKKTAEQLGIAFQNVEKRCVAARWQVVKEVEEEYREFVGHTMQVSLV